MEIYQSDRLLITKKNNTLIHEWTTNNVSIDEFQTELKTSAAFSKEICPNSVLWLQENFDFNIPPNLFNWIENNIVVPTFNTGMDNLGFTVSNDMMAHLSVMKSFEEVESVIKPNFFTDKNAAIIYFNQKAKLKNDLTYRVRELGNIAKVDITINFDLLPKVISLLEDFEKEQQFVKDNINKFNSLSKRELQIVKLIVNNYGSKEIACKLLISVLTVGTHRKSIIKKLKIKRPMDWLLFGRAFNLFN